MKFIKSHLLYYVVLFVVLAMGIVLLYLLNNTRAVQLYIAFFLYVFYIVWGISHHVFHHKITMKIVIEYTMIGLVGLSLLFFILIGGLGK